MTIAQTLLRDFDNEMAITRTLLERVPEDAAEWKPHPKSMSMGGLASHIASMPRWVPEIMQQSETDFATPAGARFATPKFESTQRLLEQFDEALREARPAITAGRDTDMDLPWALRAGERRIFSQPRSAALRSFVLSHIIHHRGQLSVYLRLRDVPLPPIYGPTADS